MQHQTDQRFFDYVDEVRSLKQNFIAYTWKYHKDLNFMRTVEDISDFASPILKQ